MTCQDIEPALSAWLDGQLSEEHAQCVREHLARCPVCWEEVEALETLGHRVALLKSAAPTPVPEGLLAGVRALPRWLVWLAVSRRWLAMGTGLAAVGIAAWLLLEWSAPLPATVTARGIQATQTLIPGTTLVARSGERLHLDLPAGRAASSQDAASAGGTIDLAGPGALVVQRATTGRLHSEQRLEVELIGGTATVRFGAQAILHDIRFVTPHALIQLTGTWVVIASDAEGTTTQVRVLEGRAAITNRSTRAQVSLQAGQRAQVRAEQLIVAPIPVEEWLAHKGLINPAEQSPGQIPLDGSPEPAVVPQGLWHEEQ